MNIPIISFNNKDKLLLSKEINKLCNEFGFFYVKDHNIDYELIKKVESYTKKYFSLPQEFKNKFKINKSNDEKFGYYSVGEQKGYSSSTGFDYKEGAYLVDEKQIQLKNKQRIFLDESEEIQYDMVGYKKTIELYNDQLYSLCNYILELIALSLDLPNDYFNIKYNDPSSYIGLSKYPPIDKRNGQIINYGMKSHTDFGLITLLYQDSIGGLQVKVGDTFIEATPIENTFICNFGDLLQSITNGRYKSNAHRVLSNTSGKDRYSIAYFFCPPWNHPVEQISNDNSNNDINLNGITHLQYFKKQMGDFFRE